MFSERKLMEVIRWVLVSAGLLLGAVNLVLFLTR
jgi:hypothetical protein